MFPIQQERQPRRKPRAIDENLKCLICPREVEREIVDLNCSCFKNLLCRFCFRFFFETFCDKCASARQLRDNRD